MKASITPAYRSNEKVEVTLTLMPSARVEVMADRLATVAGIVTSTLGRSTILGQLLRLGDGAGGVVRQARFDFDRDPAVDPPVDSYSSWNRLHASRTSSVDNRPYGVVDTGVP